MNLVERLLDLDEKGYGPRTGSVGAEAAAEIARLESALAGEKNLTLSLAADIARLRASLPAAEDAPKIGPLTLAAIGRNHFGNPIPQEWYAAAKELLAMRAAEDARDKDRLDWLATEYIKVDPFEMPTGGGDADVGWRFSQYHCGKPREVVVHEHYKDDLREAIDAAMSQDSGKENGE